MLSASNMQQQHQQQQNMMQYLQQQQFVQQNFPHQQLGSLPLLGPQHAGAAASIPGLSPAMASVNTMAASLMPPHAYNTSSNTGGYHTGNGAAHPNGQPLNPYHMPPILHNNNNQPPPVDPNRPAPVHLGPPFQTHHHPAHPPRPSVSHPVLPSRRSLIGVPATPPLFSGALSAPRRFLGGVGRGEGRGGALWPLSVPCHNASGRVRE